VPSSASKHIQRAYKFGVILLTDLAILLVVLFGITTLDYAVAYASAFLGHGTDILIYDRIPIRYLYQTIDVALIITFGIFVVIDIIHVFNEE